LKIAEVKKLDNGVSNIIIEGRITKVLKPRHGQYGWSQFVVIKDDSGDIGSNINIENEEEKYQGGEYIKIKGKVSHYIKGDKKNVSLNGNVIDEIVKDEEVSQEQPQDNTQPVEKTVETVEKEYTKADYWREKALREIENNKCIVRECAIKAVSEEAVINLFNIVDEKQYFGIADKIVDYINQSQTKTEIIKPKITLVEEAVKEFGGTVEEPNKEQKIARARELVRNPHLTEPANNTMATIPQKKRIYGYINEEGKKIGGIIDSQYMTKEEKEGIGDWKDLTKSRAFKMLEKWYGTKETLGIRDKRELEAKDKNPFLTERKPLEKRDPNNNTPLTKDVLIDDIQALRKKLFLEDDAKFTEKIGFNTNFEKWTEKELSKLKALLKDWKPSWVTEK